MLNNLHISDTILLKKNISQSVVLIALIVDCQNLTNKFDKNNLKVKWSLTVATSESIRVNFAVRSSLSYGVRQHMFSTCWKLWFYMCNMYTHVCWLHLY